MAEASSFPALLGGGDDGDDLNPALRAWAKKIPPLLYQKRGKFARGSDQVR